MLPRGQSLAHGLLDREIGKSTNRGHGFGVSQIHQQGILLSNIEFGARPALVPLPPAVETTGVPIVAKFNKNPCFGNGKLLAVGGEEGVVTIANTESIEALEQGRMDASWRPRAHWPCHRNSIFDLAWAKNDSVLFTASGHQQVGLWDTDTARALAVAEGHEGSIKSIATLHLCEDVFATGARDGRMMLWDARCPGFGGQAPAAGRRTPAGTDLDNAPVLSPVWVQDNAHARTSAPGGNRASAKAAKPPAVTVTSVAFLPYSYLLASGGAHDTVVKLWDLRMHGLPLCDLELPKVETASGRSGSGRASMHKAKTANADSKSLPHEVADFTCPTRASAVGVTHLAVSDSGDRLLVSCLDSQHHLFSISRLASGPLTTWRAPPPAGKGTFYMRSAFSPCGNYILSGSRDAGAHIWLAADPQRSAIELPHEHEVTGVAWCGSDWSQVATCCDSGEVRVWTLNRQPAHARRRTEEAAAPAMASHMTELDVAPCGSSGADGNGIQRHSNTGACPSAVPAGLRSPCKPVKPLMRRTVQLRLNLQRRPAAAPPPATVTAAAIQPSAPAVAADVAAAAPPSVVPLLAVMEAAASPAAVHAGLAHELFLRTAGGACGLKGKLAPACAAAVRATAVGTPVSSSAPAAPASAGPSCARRAAMLPPVPIFSPAINSWQQQPPRVTPETEQDTSPAPSAPAARLPRAAEPTGAGSSAFGGLEAAMKNLAQVRTQSPARMLPRCDFSGAKGGLDGFVHSAAGPNEQHALDPVFGQPSLPPHSEQPADLPTAHSFPPAAHAGAGSLLATRGLAVSPRTTPVSISRIRSRLGPFSPSRSTFSSGSGPFSNAPHSGGHSNGGAVGTPTASQRHTPGQAPQGVVDQILRKSPRYSSRTGHAAGGDSLISPRFRRTSLEGPGEAAEVAVPRRLFATDGDGDDRPLGSAPGPAAGAVQVPRAALSSGVDLVAAVDSLLQQPSLGLTALDIPAASRTPPRLSMSPVVYDFHDGQDVGPALRYRAAHPDDLGPYVDFSLDAAADREQIGRGPEEPQLQSFMPDAGGLLFGWDSFTGVGGAAGLGAASSADRDLAGEQVGNWFLRRAVGSEGGFMVSADAVGDVGTDDDSDSDWESDPYGDKENTPPPEPLPDHSHQTSSGGSGAPFASPSRRSQPEDDQPLPLLLLEPVSSTPTRAAAAAAGAPFAAATATTSVGAPSGLRWTRLTTPFAAAYPIAAAVGSVPAEGVAAARPGGAPSLHSEPTVSAGIAPSSTGAAAAGGLEGAGTGGTVAEGGHHMPSVRGSRGAAGEPVELVTASRSYGGASAGPNALQTERRQSIDGTNEAVSSGDSGQRHHAPCVDDHLTPTKRPRRAYSSSDDQGSAGDRSPSPTRRVRSSGVLAGPAPTPNAKHRFGGAYAAAMPSPAVRSGRHGGISRLAPAPGAGYLLTAAAVAAAGIGSESPAIKVGTVPRTGGRHTAASEEFFRRREQEERSHAMMSPFGFGMFSGAAATPGGGASRGAPCTSLGGLGTVAETEMELESGGVEEGGRGGGSSVRRALGLELLKDDDFGPMEKSVRSLSRMFETSSQGGGDDGGIPMVPCTFPRDDEGGGGAQDEGQSRRLAVRLPFEERTIESPAVMPCCSNGGAAGTEGGDEGGYFEPDVQRVNEGRERQGSFRFSTVLCRDPQPARELFQGGGQSAFALQASEMRMEESSRSAHIRSDGTAEGGAVLQTAWSGHGVSFPRGFRSQGLSAQAGIDAIGAGSRSAAPAGRSGGMGPQPVLSRVSPSPQLFGGMLGSQEPATAATAGVEEQQAQPVQPLHRPRQMTLQELWGPAQRHQTPPMTRPTALSAMPLSRNALGPTGLTSPRFLR